MFPTDKYPYTNFHELNLAYFITHFREIFSQWADLYDQMVSWKNATDEELATWKAGVEADLDQREAALRAELETWKAQTGQDIAGWEDATLAALTAWQTATQAVFEAIRVEAAGSASAAAASATDAATAKTAAETAQAAAEAAAASVQASAAQITTNTEDIADLKTQFDDLKNLADISALESLTIDGAVYSGNTSGDTAGEFTTSAPSIKCSDFIPVNAGDIVRVKNGRAPNRYNVISFYSSNTDASYVGGIMGGGASTNITNSYECLTAGYVRFCTRSDLIATAGTDFLLPNPIADRIAAMEEDIEDLDDRMSTAETMNDAQQVRLGELDSIVNFDTVNDLLTLDGAVYSGNTSGDTAGEFTTSAPSIKCSDFIPVNAGDIVRVKNGRAPNRYNVISFYSSNSDASYVGGIMGGGASTNITDSYECLTAGYVRFCTRDDLIATAGTEFTLPNPLLKVLAPPVIKYVATDGSDSNTGNNWADSYATVAKAISAGADIVYMGPGEFTESLSYTTGVTVDIIGNNTTVKALQGWDFRNSRISLHNILIDMAGATGQYNGFVIRDSVAHLKNCGVINAIYHGFRLDGSFSILEECYAENAAQDGFNAHDTESNISEGYFINCKAENCGDDGLSYHEEGIMHVLGGEYSGNTQTGIAPHNNCSCTIQSAYIHHNVRAGIEALVGSYTQGIPDPLPVMILTDCIFEGNTGNAVTVEHYNVKANGNGAYGNTTDSIVDSAGSTITIFTALT